MSTNRAVKSLILACGGVFVVFGLLVFWGWYTFLGPGYYAEFNDIKARLEAMSDVSLVEAGGNEDVTFEDIWATLRVKGKGEIRLYGLTRGSFEDAPHIILGSIGSYDLATKGEGHLGAYKTATGEPVRSQFFGHAIDIGREGAFARFFPFEVRHIQDVIDRYDGILEVVDQWPREPGEKHFKDEKGTDYYYYVQPIESADRRVPSESALSRASGESSIGSPGSSGQWQRQGVDQ